MGGFNCDDDLAVCVADDFEADVPLGGDCSEGICADWLEATYCDNVEKVCKLQKSEGETCGHILECQITQDFYCDSDGDSTCKALEEVGGPCSANYQCAQSTCIDTVCAEPPVDECVVPSSSASLASAVSGQRPLDVRILKAQRQSAAYSHGSRTNVTK